MKTQLMSTPLLPGANYPPVSAHQRLIDQFVSVYSTSIDNKDGFYVSCPMTSGKRYLTAIAQLSPGEQIGSLRFEGLPPEKRQVIFRKNCHHAQSVVAMTRLQFPTASVIDPTKFHVESWETDDYLSFWREVIIKHVSVMRFIDDWEYSNGCAYEFAIGVITQKHIINERGHVITPNEGYDMILKAMKETENLGGDVAFMKAVLRSLDLYNEDDGA